MVILAGYLVWESMKHALLLHHWDGLEMCGTFNELYRNKSSNTKPEHISNFNTMVSEDQPLSQLCQEDRVSEELMNTDRCPQGRVMSGKGYWTLWMSMGRATAGRGREQGAAVGAVGGG